MLPGRCGVCRRNLTFLFFTENLNVTSTRSIPTPLVKEARHKMKAECSGGGNTGSIGNLVPPDMLTYSGLPGFVSGTMHHLKVMNGCCVLLFNQPEKFLCSHSCVKNQKTET